MRYLAYCPLLVLSVALVKAVPLSAQAVPSTATDCVGYLPVSQYREDCARREFAESRSRSTTMDNGVLNPGSTTFVESASSVADWAIAIGNKSSLKGYQFPATLSVNPIGYFDQNFDRSSWIRRAVSQLQFSATYAPLVLSPKTDNSPGVASAAANSGAFGLKMTLFGGRGIDDDLAELDARLGKGLAAAQRDRTVADANGLPLPGKIQDFNKIAQQPAVLAVANLKRELNVAAKWGYQGVRSALNPNSTSGELDVSKMMGARDTPLWEYPVVLGGSVIQTWFGPLKAEAQYEETSVAAGPTVSLPNAIDLTVQGEVDRYYGVGFPGTPGVAETARATDLGLVQAMKISIRDAILTLSVKELHLGTGDTDVALSALLSFNPIRLNPKRSS
jgi:hypothetical protein